MYRFDVVVIGAGVVGLAIARTFAIHGQRVLVLERNRHFGCETSSRNSEVIHAGLYYPTGSLKADLCVRGRDLLYDYCERAGVPYRNCGKLIVSTTAEEEGALEALRCQALANGAGPVTQLSATAARRLEPNLACTSALVSPRTGIIDSHALMLAMIGDLEAQGGTLALRTVFISARVARGSFVVVCESEGDRLEIGAERLINSAGLAAHEVARRIEGVDPLSIPPRYLAKGHYFSCSGPPPFSRLVYPMHDHAGLGVHATVDMQGRVRFGPDVEWVNAVHYGVEESRRQAFVVQIRRYWPGVSADRLAPDYTGIRPKLVGPGTPASDFMIASPAEHGVGGLVQLFGIESPGLTASLAIAERVGRLI